MIDRRQFLHTLGGGFGVAGCRVSCRPTLFTRPHFAPKAKHVIFLFMNGGMSQVDTFDPKPALTKYEGSRCRAEDPTDRASRRRYAVAVQVQEVRPERARGQRDLSRTSASASTTSASSARCTPTMPNHEPSLHADELRRHQLPGRSLDGRVAHLRPRHREPESARLRRALPRRLPSRARQLWSAGFLPGDLSGHVHSTPSTRRPEKLIAQIRNTDADRATSSGSSSTCSSS